MRECKFFDKNFVLLDIVFIQFRHAMPIGKPFSLSWCLFCQSMSLRNVLTNTMATSMPLTSLVETCLWSWAFFGTTENAVYAQIWIAVCDYLLLAIAKKMFHIDQNLYIFSQAIGLVLFETIPVSDLFKRVDNSKLEPRNDGQLMLF